MNLQDVKKAGLATHVETVASGEEKKDADGGKFGCPVLKQFIWLWVSAYVLTVEQERRRMLRDVDVEDGADRREHR